MTSIDLLYRPMDPTIRICRKCHCVIPGEARRVVERGVVCYEHTYDCRPDPDRCCATGEAREIRR